MKKFGGTDFCLIDSMLSEEELMVRSAVRDWVDEKVLPFVAGHYRENRFPLSWKDDLAELGVLGAALEDHGGSGLSNVCRGLIYQELERGDSGLRSFASVTNGLVIDPIHRYGSEEQKARWLPALVRGEAVGCFGLSEPDFGSNPGGMLTRAERVEGGWRINGTKRWITNGSIADVAVVFARTEEGIRAFLVETDREGFSAPRIEAKWSLCASVTSELVLEDCVVPDESLMPGSSVGLKAALTSLNEARYSIAWGAVGAMMACYEEGLEYARTRRQFGGKPLAAHQLVQKRLSWMLTELTKAQLLALQVGRLKDRGLCHHAHISMAKRNNTHWALEIAREVRDLLGASGITFEYQVGRHLLNLETVKTYEGTDDIHHLVLGEHITQQSAFD
jgi:glutaryl-CoA dehydrogenase